MRCQASRIAAAVASLGGQSGRPAGPVAAVVIVASISLADIPATLRLWHQRHADFYIAMAAFGGVVLLGRAAAGLVADRRAVAVGVVLDDLDARDLAILGVLVALAGALAGALHGASTLSSEALAGLARPDLLEEVAARLVRRQATAASVGPEPRA